MHDGQLKNNTKTVQISDKPIYEKITQKKIEKGKERN